MTYDIFLSPLHLLSCCHEKFVFAPIVKLECFPPSRQMTAPDVWSI